MDNMQKSDKSFIVAHSASASPVYPGNGRVNRAAFAMVVNKGYVAPEPFSMDYAYPGAKHGIEKIFEHVQVTEDDSILSEDVEMRTAKRLYVRKKRIIGGIFVALGVVALAAAVAILVLKYIV